jgi:hypothetical protein
MSIMMNEEKPCDYLCQSSRPTVDGNFVTRHDRAEIVDWMYTIVDNYGIDFEIVVMAMGIVDRFLSNPSGIAQGALRDRSQFELVANAALSICIKTGEEEMPESDFLAGVSRGIYSVPEIEDMESNIRKILSSGINAPTSIQIAKHFLSLALPGVNPEESRWNYFLDDVRFQLEYAVGDYFFTAKWPRTVAMAAILNTLDELWGQDRQLMLRAFPSIVNKNFSSLTDVRAAKQRLLVEMERGHTTDVSDTIMANMLAETC